MNVPLATVESPAADALRENVPSVPRVTLHPANEATPALVASGLVVHASVPEPEFRARVIEPELAVATLPPASSSETCGCTAKTVALVDASGVAVNASCVAGPTVTANVLVVAAVSEPSVAVSR